MRRLAWWLQRRSGALALVLGGLLAGAALLLHWLYVLPLQQRLDQLQASPTPAREVVQVAPDSPRIQLASFYRYFAQDETLVNRLERVHAIATGLGLEMKRAEYRLNSLPDRKIDRYQMIVPIQGNYSQVRAFVSQVLRESPTIAVDQIQLQRKDIADSALDSQISFTFFLPK